MTRFLAEVCHLPRGRVQGVRQRLAATPHPLFLQRTLVSRKRAKIGARAGPIWHYVALRGTRRPLHVRVLKTSRNAVRSALEVSLALQELSGIDEFAAAKR